MTTAVKSQSIENTFLVDESKNYFIPLHPRGPKVVSREFVVQPTTGIDPARGVGSKTIEFRIPRDKGQFLDDLYLHFEMELKAAFCATLYGVNSSVAGDDTNPDNFNLTFIDYPALFAIKKAELNYGGDLVEEILGGDQLRDAVHLFRSDTDKLSDWKLASGYYKGWNQSYVLRNVNDHGRQTNGTGSNNNIGVMWDQSVSLTGVTASNITALPKNGWGAPMNDTLGNSALERDFNINSRYSLHKNIGGHGENSLIGATQASSGFRVKLSVKLPFSNTMSLDRNAPVGLLDQDIILLITFTAPSTLIQRFGVNSAAKTGLLPNHVENDIIFSNPTIRCTFREQAAPTFATLARQPSITYPMSKYIVERILIPKNSPQQLEIPIKQLRGLIHVITLKLRPVGAVDGQIDFAHRGGVAPNVHAVKLYDPSYIDMNIQDTDTVGRFAGSQRQLESFDILSNGVSIIGKVPQDARHNLTAYKPKLFSVCQELERPYAFKIDSPVAPYFRGYNLYAYCFGTSGARNAAGTGVINWDSLGPKRLLLNFRTAGVDGFQPCDQDQYLDIGAWCYGVSVIEKGIWYRDLSA